MSQIRTEVSGLPSLFDLARAHRAMWDRIGEIDRARLDVQPDTDDSLRVEAAYGHAYNEARALGDLILARRVESMADAVAVAVHGQALAEAREADPQLSDMETLNTALSRLAAFLAPIAGVDLNDLGCRGAARVINRNAGLEVVP